MSLTVPGIDFAWGHPPYDAVKRAGRKFVLRYISHDPTKDLTQGELAEWHKRGIAVGVVFESAAKRAALGYSAGVQDAHYSQQRLVQLGVPAAPCYFAVDFNPEPSQLRAVLSYLRGAASVLGKSRLGVYGGYDTVSLAATAGVCTYFWQTAAWSHLSVHAATDIYQYRNGVNFGGVSCDLNHARDNGPYGVIPAPAAQNAAARKRHGIWAKHLKDALKKDGALHRRIKKLRRLVARKRAAQK